MARTKAKVLAKINSEKATLAKTDNQADVDKKKKRRKDRKRLIREMIREQKSVRPAIPTAAIERYIREIIQELAAQTPGRESAATQIQKSALCMISAAAEAFLIDKFKGASAVSTSQNKQTLTKAHWDAAEAVRKTIGGKVFS